MVKLQDHPILANIQAAGPKMYWNLYTKYSFVNVYWLKAQGILEVAVLARNVSLIR